MYLNRVTVRGGVDAAFMEAQMRQLIAAGLHVENPYNGVISGFDGTGERVELADGSDWAGIRARVTGVQLWFDDSSDVFVSWSNGGSLEVHVDGLDQARITQVAAAVSTAVVDACLREKRDLYVVFERI
jgi:hypothetical protein